jgi:Uncharacterized protein conserved in bacteria
MEWEVLFTDEFGVWWNSLSVEEQTSIDRSVGLLREAGPNLPHPHSSAIATSAYSGMRELRTQHGGRPYRTLYLFDPLRRAVLLIGGEKTGNDRWYEIYVPKADAIYRQYLRELEDENAR